MSDSGISKVRNTILQWVVPSSFITWFPVETLSYQSKLTHIPQQHVHVPIIILFTEYMHHLSHSVYHNNSKRMHISGTSLSVHRKDIYSKWVHAITWNRIAAVTAREGDRGSQRLSEVRRFMGFIGAGVRGCFSLII